MWIRPSTRPGADFANFASASAANPIQKYVDGRGDHCIRLLSSRSFAEAENDLKMQIVADHADELAGGKIAVVEIERSALRVVQRVPVKIRFIGNADRHRLVPGLSGHVVIERVLADAH